MNIFSPVVLLSLIFLTFVCSQAQTKGSDESYCDGLSVSPKRCVEIGILYDAKGDISNLTVSLNKEIVNAFTSPGIPRENVMKIIDEYFPPEKRGRQISRSESSFGRAFAERTVFERLSLTLTITCRQNGRCGVSYAIASKTRE